MGDVTVHGQGGDHGELGATVDSVVRLGTEAGRGIKDGHGEVRARRRLGLS